MDWGIHRFAVTATLLITSFNFANAEVVVQGHLPSGVEIRAVEVSFADLNIRNPAGQAALMGRLRTAVRDVCDGPLVSYRDQQELRRYRSCNSDAMADATSKAESVIASASQPGTSVASVITVRTPNE